MLVWLLLLAVPFQGFAAAGMLARGPSMSMPMHELANAHATTPMAKGTEEHGGHCAGHALQAGQQHDAPPQQDGHHVGKASACADCCAGATMAPAVLPALVLAPPHFISIPFRAGHVPSVDPALPERPPRTALA
ncbi:hypothetical protein FBX97_0983 [Herbaspirillum sp. SJZ107]|nr:hypothetical protein FBX97_0983 [Herbaspirillum sp. SJZ107]